MTVTYRMHIGTPPGPHTMGMGVLMCILAFMAEKSAKIAAYLCFLICQWTFGLKLREKSTKQTNHNC